MLIAAMARRFAIPALAAVLNLVWTILPVDLLKFVMWILECVMRLKRVGTTRSVSPTNGVTTQLESVSRKDPVLTTLIVARVGSVKQADALMPAMM